MIGSITELLRQGRGLFVQPGRRIGLPCESEMIRVLLEVVDITVKLDRLSDDVVHQVDTSGYGGIVAGNEMGLISRRWHNHEFTFLSDGWPGRRQGEGASLPAGPAMTGATRLPEIILLDVGRS